MNIKQAFFVLAWLYASSLPLLGEGVDPSPVRLQNLSNVAAIVKLVDGLKASFPLATVKAVDGNVLLIVPRPGKTLTTAAVTKLQDAIQSWDQASSDGVPPVPVQIQNLSDLDDIVKLVDGLATTFTTATVKKIGDRAVLIVPRTGQTLTAAAVKALRKAITAWDTAASQASPPKPIPVANLPIDETVKWVEGSEASFPTATVKKLDSRTLLVVPRADRTLTVLAVDELRGVIEEWDRSARGNPSKGVPRVIQLFHLRKAQDIVNALNPPAKSGIQLKRIEDDKLVILGSNEAAVGRLRRLIAVLDQPRPQITLQLWTLQVSDRNSQVIEDKFEGSRRLIRLHDEMLRNIYTRISNLIQTSRPSGGLERLYS